MKVTKSLQQSKKGKQRIITQFELVRSKLTEINVSMLHVRGGQYSLAKSVDIYVLNMYKIYFMYLISPHPTLNL